jgi:gamma-glutamyltranspeptidase/glutathione hydrolase
MVEDADKSYKTVQSSGIPKPGWRSRAVGIEGMVVTGHPLVSAVAWQVLEAGGNAVDAAIAAVGMLAVAQPMMCGLGGDVFLVYHDVKTGRLWALNGGGKAPQRATVDWYHGAGFDEIPLDGMLSAAVPGTVDACVESLRRWGTIPLKELWGPAVRYAENGVALTERVADWIAWAATRLRQFPETAAIYLPNGKPPRAGTRLVQRDLGATLAKTAEGGTEVFYRGEIAAAIADHSERRGALLSREDLTQHVSEVYEPISVQYRGCEVFTTAPPSQGFLLLEMMNLIEGFDLPAMGANSVDAIHAMVEAKKIAFDDRNAYFGDPAFIDNPLTRVLSKDYARQRRVGIDLTKAAQRQYSDAPVHHSTTSFCVTDSHGNAVSLIASLWGGFGCADAVPGIGLLLNNSAGNGFNLIAGHPNCVASGKRPMHSLHCFIVMRKDALYLVGGTAGGFFQPQWNAQVLANVIDFGMNAQQAVEAPRWSSYPGTEPGYWRKPFLLQVEDGIDPLVRQELAVRGHDVSTVPYIFVGSGFQLIEVDEGTYAGGSDPRGEGAALGR